jgi:DNA-binding transcriptional MocR family regulator
LLIILSSYHHFIHFIKNMIKNVHGNTVDHIGEAIVAGRYGVGASIPPEPVLCLELGVSRTVVREAVKSLIAKGLMTTGPKVGTRVLSEEHWNWFDPDVIIWQSKAGLTPEFLRGRLAQLGQMPARSQHFFYVVVRAVNQLPDGGFRGIRLMRNDSVEYRTMQLKRGTRAARAAGRDFKTGAQQGAQHLAHLLQHAVAAGAQQALVKAQVKCHVIATALYSTLHACVGTFNLCYVFGRRAFSRQAHGGGLHHTAQVLQVSQLKAA